MNRPKTENKELAKTIKVFNQIGITFIIFGILGGLVISFLGLTNNMALVLILLVGGIIISGISKVLFHISIMLNKLNEQSINEGQGPT